jgi:predicted amidophosphoribosyltransferase
MIGSGIRLAGVGLAPLLRRVEDFFVPPLCVVCDAPLDADDRWFCGACLEGLSANHSSRDACPRCALNRRKRECACEFAWDFPFEKAFSVYDYDDTLKSVARHIKYKGKRRLAYHIGTIAAPLVPADFLDGADMAIPVPLHKARLRRRGYNQSEYLAKGVLAGLKCLGNDDIIGNDSAINDNGLLDDSNLLGNDNANNPPKNLPLRTDLLKRIKNTVTQTKLDREGRQENLIGAFAANPTKLIELKDKRIILVDDILTTGATTEACTEELLRAGCASVRVLSMGHD